MNDFAEKYAKNVAVFYNTLLGELCNESPVTSMSTSLYLSVKDFARASTIKAVPYLMPMQEFPHFIPDQELGKEVEE